jgi:alpha-beta hydrolase superfamily lysophospholipase
LQQLVIHIRAGKFSSTPRKVVLVGHSFGSVVSNALLAATPNLVDGAILTGIGYDIPSSAPALESLQPRLARLQSSVWNKLDSGYATWVDIFANVNTYNVLYPLFAEII